MIPPALADQRLYQFIDLEHAILSQPEHQSDSNPRTADLLQVLRRGAGMALAVQILGVALVDLRGFENLRGLGAH